MFSFIVGLLLISITGISCLFVTAEDVLELTGPTDVFEGESVEFTVTLNGEPVQARVIFGDLTPANYSNSTTGKVRFIAPSVPSDDMEYEITASLLGGLSASHTILVKNTTAALTIEVNSDFVVETEEFIVTVMQRDVPVMDATVWFNSAVYATNESGMVRLVAPDVLVTSTYGITVNKTGYKSSLFMITIQDDQKGQMLMEVIAPSIVEPGEEQVEIQVISSTGGLENVEIDVYYEDQLYGEYFTDADGKAFILCPLINTDNYFLLDVEKEGYQTYYSEEEFMISLFERDLTADLKMAVNPSEMYEGEMVTVEITNDVGVGVEGVAIWRGDTQLGGLTDSQGIITFIAPSVFMDREYFLYALKEGFNFVESTITIRQRSSQKHLTIDCQRSVNESELFSVVVKDNDNSVLSDVVVSFNDGEQTTNEYGIVSFVTPNVTSTGFFVIEATKSGYDPAWFSVEIVDSQDSNGQVSKELVLCVEPSIMENQAFVVTVRDSQGIVVAGAQVSFKGTSLETDFKGEVLFSAPDVSWDELENIRATKNGYSSASQMVTIKNIEGFAYWYVLLIVVVIIIIGSAAYFRYGRIY